MNFVDTAITLLHEAGKPVGVEQLCELAIERGMLDKPGANPLRSMKTRLTVELKKGDDSRLQKVGDDEWVLCDGVELPDGAEDFIEAKPAKKTRAKSKAKTSKAAKDDKEKKPAKKTRTKAKPADEEEAAPAKKTRAKKNGKASVKAADESGEAEAESAEVEASDEPVSEEVIEPEVELTPEEKALVELYSDEVQDTMSAAVLNEYSDEHTRDEDRLMLPEIRPERKTRHRRDRKERRPRRKRREGRGESSSVSAESSSESGELRDISGVPIEVTRAKGVPGEEIVRLALQVLATLPPGQSMPVRQLTQTMVRKGLIEGKADRLWRMVKGTLLAAEQRRSTRGLGAKVRYHGRDLFSVATSEGRSVLGAAEEALRRAAEDYAEAVERDYRDRLATLAPGMLERIAYVYLQTTGWSGVEWIKKVEKSCYGIGTAPGDVEPSMIAVRSGPDEIDRRGVGELRAGMYAKGLQSGLLISACELSDDAKEELGKEGGYVRLLTGKAFVSDLLAREVGASWKHFQLPSIDQRFLDALLG